MLQQIKQLLVPEKWPMRKPTSLEGGWWKKLTIGSKLTFGFMAQTELTQKELEVSDMVLYDFGQLQFLSYNLSEQGKPMASFIMAGTETGSPYLAISRKLSQRDLEKLFADEDLKRLSTPGAIKNLYVRDHVPGLKEWVTMKYSRRIEGIRGKKNDKGTDRVFEYALFVNESNEKAVEVEYFLDGHVEMYATIYRPMKDVVSLHLRSKAAETITIEPEFKFEKRPPAPVPVSPMQGMTNGVPHMPRPVAGPRVMPEPVKPKPVAAPPMFAPKPVEQRNGHRVIEEAPPPPPVMQKPVQPEPAAPPVHVQRRVEAVAPPPPPVSMRPVPLMQPMPEKPATAPVIRKAFGPTVSPVETAPAPQASRTVAPIRIADVKEETLAVSMVTAARIITEAMSKNRRISVVLRDILGLDEGASDKVLFHLPLSDDDYLQLGQRYDIPAEDRVAIRRRILEELNLYTRPEKLQQRVG